MVNKLIFRNARYIAAEKKSRKKFQKKKIPPSLMTFFRPMRKKETEFFFRWPKHANVTQKV